MSFSQQDYSKHGNEIRIINMAIADCQIIGYDWLVGIDLLILRTGTIHLFEGNV